MSLSLLSLTLAIWNSAHFLTAVVYSVWWGSNGKVCKMMTSHFRTLLDKKIGRITCFNWSSYYPGSAQHSLWPGSSRLCTGLAGEAPKALRISSASNSTSSWPGWPCAFTDGLSASALRTKRYNSLTLQGHSDLRVQAQKQYLQLWEHPGKKAGSWC